MLLLDKGPNAGLRLARPHGLAAWCALAWRRTSSFRRALLRALAAWSV